MDISVTEFKRRCLEIIRRVEHTGRPVTIVRRGKAVAQLGAAPRASVSRRRTPWERVRALGGVLDGKPGASVLREKDFEALR